jgi:hypothetical protein
MTKKILFSGCSYTAGNGWLDIKPEESIQIEVKDCPYLWVNLCHSETLRFNHLKMINLGQGGASNTEIFTNTIRAIAELGDSIDTIFCQWTSMPRYNWNVGFELWNTSENFDYNPQQSRKPDVNLNKGDIWSRTYLNELTDRLRVLHHLHWEIVKVVDYSHVIYTLAKKLGIANVFFINGLCPWDQNYFVELPNAKPEEYTEFTKINILNIDSRDDKEIFELYTLAHRHYNESGGIDSKTWINLYDPFNKNKIDTNYDKQHPGIESNRRYYNMIDIRLRELGFV